jgi:GMP synthase-like glutamine amidotransferase
VDLMRMQIGLVDCGSRGVERIRTILSVAGAAVAIIPLPQIGATPPPGLDAVVISGGPHLFTAGETGVALVERFAFIDRFATPILGICLGHQAIGLRFGAQVYRGPAVRRPEPIHITAPHSLFAGIPSGAVFVEDHTEGITLPPGFSHLAESGTYPLEAMAHRSRPLYGVQFHPEVSGRVGERVLENFLELTFAWRARGKR